MNEYEVLIETINPCGGEAHSKKEFKEIEAESPESYVRAEGRWPILDSGKNASGDVVITTGDGKGNMVIEDGAYCAKMDITVGTWLDNLKA